MLKSELWMEDVHAFARAFHAGLGSGDVKLPRVNLGELLRVWVTYPIEYSQSTVSRACRP